MQNKTQAPEAILSRLQRIKSTDQLCSIFKDCKG